MFEHPREYGPGWIHGLVHLDLTSNTLEVDSPTILGWLTGEIKGREEEIARLSDLVEVFKSPRRRLRRWLYRHGIRMHAQNLARDSGGRERSMLWEGRAWITVFRPASVERDEDGDIVALNPSWHIRLQNRAGVGVTIGDEDDIVLSLSTPVASLWLAIDKLPRRWIEAILPGYWIDRGGNGNGRYTHYDRPGPVRLKITEAREICIGWHSGSLWWSLWHSTMEWSSRTPRWRHGSFDPIDAMLGRPACTREKIGPPVRALAPFPEGTYPLTLQREVGTWKRPRWPWARVRRWVDITAEHGAPAFRAKGENSYDLDDDAILGMSSEGHSYDAAVGAYVAAVLHNRARYGHVKPEDRAVFAEAGS